MAGLHFDITGDNSNFMEKLRQTERGISQTSKTIEQSGIGIEDMFGRMTKAAAGFGAAFSAQQFASQVLRVRGEFQQLEVAFETMLGSAEKANALMAQLTRTAAITPFGLQDVAGGAKQLLAYGVASEQVNDTLVRLGDIAAGLSIPLNDLVYLYGTTMTQGKLFTQDLRQFQGRGIPLADELAKQFGVAKDKVGELVTAGKVGFPEVEKAIVAMTSEGGKFGGLMEAQSKTITGQISNIEDAIDGMFNQIGQSSEGAINAALGGVSALVENWEKIAETIGYAVSAYGSYKAALMVTSAVDGVKTDLASTEEIVRLSEILGLKEEIKNADLEEAVAKGTLSQAKADYMAKLREEVQNRMTILNLQKEEAEAEAKAALEAFNAAKQEKESADERLENMMNLMEAAEAQGDASYTAYAQEQLQTASANANTAAIRLNTAEKNLNSASSRAKSASQAADTFATNANTIANNANTKSLNLMKAAALQLQGILKSMYATLMANPLAIVVGAVGALSYGIYTYATRASAAEKITTKFNDSLDEQTKKHNDYKKEIDDLVSTLGNVEISEGTRISNFQKLKNEYTEILKNINDENQFLKEKHKILQLINQEQSKELRDENEYQLRVEEQKLKRWESHLKKYGDTSLVDVDGNGWASDNVTDAINVQREIVNQLKAKIAQPVVEGYLAGIKELKDENIVSTLEDITNTLKALGGAGDNAIGILSNLGEVSKSQLKTIKSALLGELDARGGEKLSASQWLAKYKKEYEASVKAISDFQKKKNELSEVEFERQLKDLKDKRDAAKKKFEDARGSTKTDNKRLEQERKISNEIISILRDNQQNEINLMAEGSEKKRKQIELNYQREIDEVKKQKKAWEDAQSGVLTNVQKESLDSRSKSAKNTRDSGLAKITKDETEMAKQTMNEYLKEYGSWMDKRRAITDIYNEKINKATTKGEKLTLGEEMKRELAAVDDSVRDKTSTISKLFGDMSKKTVSDMRAIANEAQDMLSYIESGEFKPQEGSLKDSFGFTKEQYELLKASPEQLEAIKNEIANLNTEADKAEPTLKRMAKALDDIFSGKTDKFDEKLGTILDGVGQITQAAEFLGDSLSTLSDAFGGNFLGGLAEGIGVATDAANAAMSGAQAGAVFGPWGAAAGAAIGAVSSLAGSLSKLHDKKHEKRIQRLQEQIEVMEKSYERLGEAIEDAYSKDASKLIEDQNKLLEQQKVLIQQQIKEEEDKKKTDSDRIKEWKEQIEEINKTIEDNKEAAVDAIFGSDLKSAIEDFASAYIEAWSAGEDKAKSAKDMVKTMIKNMVTESIKAAASDPMKAIREKLLAFWSDEYISGWEQDYLNKMATDLQKELDSKFGWADNILDDSAYSQEASSKGMETMTQDQASELNGRFAALQMAGEEIKNQIIQSVVIMTQMLGLSSQNNGILNDILTQNAISNGYLADLVKYSKTMATYGEKIDKIIQNTQNM